MSYLEYYGLKREPFSNAPVSQFYFNSNAHAQALTRLTYVVSQSKGLALLMGESGAGKTTLARRLLDSLPEDQYEAALLVIIHSGITAGWLLKRIAVQLGVEKPADEKLALLGQLYQRLIAIHESGRRAVVLIDEAQMLQTRDIMEEFRGLLNLELPEQKLLTFVLFGLPELEQYLKLDPPLHQRVALKIRLTPLTAESTEAYIKHRLRLAGAKRMPFSAEAVRAIHRFTLGTPRLINTLCDNCLFESFMAKAPVVNEKLVIRCADELALTPLEPQPTPAPPALAPAPRPAAPSPPERTTSTPSGMTRALTGTGKA
jgi:type II secretory pathway predicted ATPase ExeA